MSDQIQIGISANAQQAVSEIDKVNQGLGGLGGGAEKATESTGGLGESMLYLNAAMEVGSKVAETLKQAYEMTVGAALELADQTRNLQNITGASAEQAGVLIAQFQDLGLSTNLLQRAFDAAIKKGFSPTIEGLQQMRAEYNAIQDPIAQTKWLMDTFGKTGAQMAEYFKTSDDALNQMADSAKKAGVVMDQTGVDAAKDYGIQVNELTQNFQGLETTIGMALIPILNQGATAWMNMNDAEKKERDYNATQSIPIHNAAANAINAMADAAANAINKIEELLQITPDYSGEVKQGTQNITDNYQAMGKASGAAVNFGVATQGAMGVIEGSKVVMEGGYSQWQALAQATGDAQGALTNVASAIDHAKDVTSKASFEMSQYTTQLLFNKAAEALNADEALVLAQRMGLIDQSSKNAYNQLTFLKDQLDRGAISTWAYEAAVAALNDEIEGLHDKTVNITVNGLPTQDLTNPGYGGKGAKANATGADYIVPPGYANEGWNVGTASSGERVTITNTNNLSIYGSAVPVNVGQEFMALKAMTGGQP